MKHKAAGRAHARADSPEGQGEPVVAPASVATPPAAILGPVRVVFVRDDAPWRRGDVKVCTPLEAEKLLRHGCAEISE